MADMERASFNGVPIWAKMIDLSGGERLVIHESPGVDGGTAESQGQLPQRYRLEFSLLRDGQWITEDYESAALDLRAMLLEGGPYTINIPTFGELTGMWVEGSYSLTFFDADQRGIAYGSLTITDLRPQIILAESTASLVANAVSDLSLAAMEAFGQAVPEGSLLDTALAELDELFTWMTDVQGLIGAAFQPINDVSGAIGSLSANVESLLRTPQAFASQVMGTAASLLSLVPSLAASESSSGSAAIQDPTADKPAIVYGQALDSGTDFDDSLPALQHDVVETPSSEDIAEKAEVDAVRQLAYTTMVVSVCLAISTTSFATTNSVVQLAEQLDGPFEALFGLGDALDYRVYATAVQLRAATRRFLSSSATALPRLRTITCPRDTDLDDILTDIYDLTNVAQVQLAIDQLAAINDIDPTNIAKGTVLQYLDPLVS